MGLKTVRIVQERPSSSGIVMTQGTKVVLDDGSELQGVTKIVLTAEVNDIWRAEIHCHVGALDMQAEAVIHHAPWHARLRLWAHRLWRGGE